MKVSMDGLRRKFTTEAQELRDLVNGLVVSNEGAAIDNLESLVEATNRVLMNVNALNCIYSKDSSDFSDMSHIEVPLIETAEG